MIKNSILAGLTAGFIISLIISGFCTLINYIASSANISPDNANAIIITLLGLVGFMIFMACVCDDDNDFNDLDIYTSLITGIASFIIFLLLNTWMLIINAFIFFMPWYAYLFIGLGITEVFFWLDKRKPKDNVLAHTAKLKLESMLKAFLSLLGFNALVNRLNSIDYNALLYWVGVIGIWILIIVGIGFMFVAYIWINSKRYKVIKELKRGRGRPRKEGSQ